ncbi:MAG TPA: hypothetical protein VF881_01750 [Polyangiaceae bacterium]
MQLTVRVDTPIPSPNRRQHWGSLADVRKRQRAAVAAALREAFGPLPDLRARLQAELPAVVVLERVSGSHKLDTDNASYSMKSIRDAIAASAFGLDDSDPNIRWTYHQTHEAGSATYCVVTIRTGQDMRLCKPPLTPPKPSNTAGFHR